MHHWSANSQFGGRLRDRTSVSLSDGDRAEEAVRIFGIRTHSGKWMLPCSGAECSQSVALTFSGVAEFATMATNRKSLRKLMPPESQMANGWARDPTAGF